MDETTKTQKKGSARIGGGRKSEPNIPFDASKRKTIKQALKEFMTDPQTDGTALEAERVYNEVATWLESQDVRGYVADSLIEMYAMQIARWIQAERKISANGFLGEHPTTGNPCISPYVTISIDFSKQANNTWWQIAQAIKEGTNGKAKVEEPTNSLMAIIKGA